MRPLAALLMLVAAVMLLLLAAGPQPAAAGCRRGRSKRPLRAAADLYLNHVPVQRLPVEDMPEEFTWSNHNGTNWLTPSWQQHAPRYCGSCWVHGTLSMVQDRLKILKLRSGDVSPDVMLGRQTLLNCASFHGMGNGCDGGDAIDVFHYMHKFGLPDESCLHYLATDASAFKERGMTRCPADKFCVNCMPAPTKKDPDAYKCWPVKKPVMYTLSAYGKVDNADEAGMMSEIMQRGPITCGIAAPDGLVFKYHSGRQGGVYVDDGSDTEIDHDVEVVGWGVDAASGLKYWLVRNSWGTYWGELGFFKVQRGAGGTGALQIESGDCWYATPDHSMEDAVVGGELEGSMYGVKRNKCMRDPAACKPLPSDRLDQAWGEWPPQADGADAPAADAPAADAPAVAPAAKAVPAGPAHARGRAPWWAAAAGGVKRALGWDAAAPALLAAE